MIIIADKIGEGTEESPFRPDTISGHWQVIEEYEDSFKIEILDDETRE